MAQPPRVGLSSVSKNSQPHQRLVVCCDGTGKNEIFDSNISNISMIARCVAAIDKPEGSLLWQAQGPQIPQIVYYQAGIGADTGNPGGVFDQALGKGTLTP